MCTHLHVDHCGWNTRLVDGRWVPTFPNAKYIFAKKEHDFWEAPAIKASGAGGAVAGYAVKSGTISAVGEWSPSAEIASYIRV